MGLTLIGVITKPQALKGEFRLNPGLLNLKKYKKLKDVVINEKVYNVEHISLRETFVVMKLEGIDDCNMAESLRNCKMYANIEEKTEESQDFIGFKVVCSDEELGEIVDVNNYGSKDVISVAGNKNFMFPLVDKLIISCDTSTLKLDKNIFEQVVVYED